mmetsp:Transcript_43862/g.103727  ORF Transcript_43862/g.103727 Transcript_43862/m.103727 type:complete len:344 (+) Transcript_43862:103-1134(+)
MEKHGAEWGSGTHLASASFRNEGEGRGSLDDTLQLGDSQGLLHISGEHTLLPPPQRKGKQPLQFATSSATSSMTLTGSLRSDIPPVPQVGGLKKERSSQGVSSFQAALEEMDRRSSSKMHKDWRPRSKSKTQTQTLQMGSNKRDRAQASPEGARYPFHYPPGLHLSPAAVNRRPASAPSMRGIGARPASVPHRPRAYIHSQPIEEEPLQECLQQFRKEKRLLKELRELKGWNKELATAAAGHHHKDSHNQSNQQQQQQQNALQQLHQHHHNTTAPAPATEQMKRLHHQMHQDIEYHGVRSGFIEKPQQLPPQESVEINMVGGLFHGVMNNTRQQRRMTIVVVS